MASVVGLVLAAGEGRRLGTPKALLADGEGRTWLSRAVDALTGGGADLVYAVVGAAADEVRAIAPSAVHVVEAAGWEEGMGASLRAGMRAISSERPEADAVVLILVDTPGVGADVVRRMAQDARPDALVRATYDGAPGHPVLIGRNHWDGVVASARGDRGARTYLAEHDVVDVECGDIGIGVDVDTREALDAWRRSQHRGR